MAEFTEVMRQAKRLCAAHDSMCASSNCPLDNEEVDACRLLPDHDGEDYNELERIIMDWAAEHPEPVYPTWKDSWKQMFPEADIERVFCPEIFGDKYKCDWCQGWSCDDNYSCDECLERPMPAEVAEKLGIKPISRQSEDVHNGCIGCKYMKRSVFEAPCAQCRGWTMMTRDPNRRGNLWEAAE
nr:MAG TPA: hypothetical protein [Caudoviricetes sp.]